MPTEVIMPRVGISVESCIVTQWHKQKGDTVKTGDVLFSYETDKATAEEEAKMDGVLLAILAQEGDEVPVLQTVCVIGQEGEAWEAPEAKTPEITVPQVPVPEISTKPVPVVATHSTAVQLNQLKISPRAKALAHKTGVEPQTLAGTGPYGRVIERDVRNAPQQFGSQEVVPVEAAVSSRSQAQDIEIIKFSGVRKAIAKAMAQSLSTIAQLTSHSSFDATVILQYKSMLKQQNDPVLAGVSLNDILLYAVAKTLKNHPDLNAHLHGDELHRYKAVHLGIAVDTPRGLLVPTLFNADTMSLSEISVAAKQLVEDAQAGTISPDLLKGATFTTSNLGALGAEVFTPVINPPQTGILGICAMVERPRMQDGKLTAYPAMGLSLTYDHRAIDGAPAARFALELKDNLENFTALLAK